MPTLRGPDVVLRVKSGTQSGSRHRVKGKGIETPKRTGDLIVTIDVADRRAPVPVVYADGERMGALPVTLEIVPAALRVLT